MTEIKRISNNCRFTYMLDFMLKPGWKLEYYENAALSKFEGNSSIDTSRKSCWKFVCAQRIWPARKLFCQPHARVILTRVIENDVNVCKQISSLLLSVVLLKPIHAMTFRAKFLLVVSICVPPNNPITACGETSFPGYHSFPKWAIENPLLFLFLGPISSGL